MKLEDIVITNPTGNITAVVFDQQPAEHMQRISADIRKSWESVEQIVFVDQRGKDFYAQMPYGEFSANAARAVGYVLARGRDSKNSFFMSGINLGVTTHSVPGYSKLSYFPKLERDSRPLYGQQVPVVKMEGIAHALLFCESTHVYKLKEKASTEAGQKQIITHLIELGLSDRPAAGLLFVDHKTDRYVITPYIYIRDTNSLRAHQSCASGSIALAHALGKNLSVEQANREILEVQVRHTGGRCFTASVAGSMSKVWEGTLSQLFEDPAQPKKHPSQRPPVKAAKL